MGLVGCSEEPDLSQPVNPPRKKEVTQPAETKTTETVQASQDLAFTYDSAGRRNPFKPLVDLAPKVEKEVEPTPGRVALLEPLQQYDTKQYKLVGVVAGGNGNYAMVESPDGKTYNFKVGTRIGRREGIVQRITATGVVVKEVIHYDSGRVEEVETTLSLNKPNE